MSTTFESRALVFGYPETVRPAVAGVNLQVPRGALYAILGPNGSGKSTLLKLLLGSLQPNEGVVLYRARSLAAWPRRALARHIGVVPQFEGSAFPLTVRELVEMGRYPHLGLVRGAGDGDRHAIMTALERCDVLELANRPVSTLSGGERQLARIARALAQEPETLVLDEPTLSLDLHHEMVIFELLRELTTRDGVTVVLVTHNVNLAARYASWVLLMHQGRAIAEGRPGDVLLGDAIDRAYRWPVVMTSHPGPGHGAGAPQLVPLAPGEERTDA